ncbi:putative leucine-rich repeat domain superfamily, F-box-like domain superfamily [Helianthus annuus]|uniref:Leucine-rich repeat domain superfamily, F-box-like domain superfamily n=2 Tax=Helianthus annuus TaxID=4232 RepID=A0A9K3IL94_HELAN|nr:putative leucine-rich repeat domain superfamily, F-box-like domain superfamily [Helianthus annuus]KAJ0550064.1 putative leucine-rich repeat domain superfamily, F-box-like domain superfamily [Helianthus annuus]KAJ0556666.1 putative leucine-rich repeat domain superfamily, F-box-like domain superfamily [Helianthus annuus]KAJ0563017.1 putative leucine-rich repeat domain superfamily, F-box-like domain superfamily [Helianthus annuus]KAJ0728388.1 putative leucine-rich repeat domain superfamily, F-b
MDRISHLPESIVHHILSFLKNTPAELVRMSVLSKSWFHLSASFPCLYFNIRYFITRESFFKYVEYTTSRFCHQNLIANRLFLVATVREHAELDIVNRCLEKVLKNGVRELAIYITNSKYRLPNILLSVSVLKTLVILGCELPSSLMLDAVRFKSLIKLSLVSVPIDDEVIKHLTTSCPLLQEFEIDSCSGLKRVCVYGHQNLQSVYIQCNTAVERIDIEAPNLSSLTIINWDGIGAPQMNLASCKKLTTVSYFGHLLPDSNGFTNFVSNFPFVENLYLAINYKCKNVKLSSHSLRTFMLHSVCDLEEIEFNTPNLALFGYPCNYGSLWPMVRRSTHLKACMQCYPDDGTDALWFLKLRLFLDKKNGFKVLNLYIQAKHSQARFFDHSFREAKGD